MYAERHGRQQRPEADGERDVSPPVDRAAPVMPRLAQVTIGPHGAEQSNGDVHPKHRAPVDDREHAARDQAQELAAEPGDLVDAEREAALVRRKRVGKDCSRICGQHRPAERLQHAPPISHSAPAPPLNGSNDNRIDANVNTAKPAL